MQLDPKERLEVLKALHGPIDICGPGVVAAMHEIREALDRPTILEFVDCPLKEVIDYLKDFHHIEIQFDMPALKEARIDPDSPVTNNVRGVSLRSALSELLKEMHLTYVVRNGMLLITTPAKADGPYMPTRFYGVEDLVPLHTDRLAATRALTNSLTETVDPKSWSCNGGPGFIGLIIIGQEPMLVVSQTGDVHEKVCQMLQVLRQE